MNSENKRKAYIWGAAENGKKALVFCKDTFNIVGFIDKNAERIGDYQGYKVFKPGEWQNKDTAEVNIIIAVRYPAQVMNEFANGYFKNIHVFIFDGRTPGNEIIYEAKEHELCVPEYMNKRYAELEEYKKHYTELTENQVLLYLEILKMIKRFSPQTKIFELGCGSGQVANMLFDHGYHAYEGVDFCEEAIRLAQKMNPEHKDDFFCDDAFQYLEGKLFENEELIMCFEMLEHINKDIELLERLPKEHNVIFSVPNFISFNHIRVFENKEEIKNRYSMLAIKEIISIKTGYANDCWYLVFATR